MKVTTKAKFVAWLKRQPAKNRYRGNSSTSCPIALYVRGDSSKNDVSVGWNMYNEAGSDVRLALPAWAQTFVQELDHLCLRGIQRKRVLEILNAHRGGTRTRKAA